MRAEDKVEYFNFVKLTRRLGEQLAVQAETPKFPAVKPGDVQNLNRALLFCANFLEALAATAELELEEQEQREQPEG